MLAWRPHSMVKRLGIAVLGALAIAASPLRAAPAKPHLDQLTLVVPAASGGGWDLTAKAMQASLEQEGLVSHVSIVRYPGAGGLIGLSQFVAHYRGDGHALLVGGLVMVGAAVRDDAALTLRDVTPIARLTGEWGVLAVPASSPYHSIDDIRAAMLHDPVSVRWVGGALGGPDQGLVFDIARHLNVPLDDTEYYGRSGGKLVVETLLQKRGDIGVSGYAEFRQQLATHALRLLAVAAPRPVPGIDAPTMRAGGIDAEMMNWRAVLGAPGISMHDEDQLSALMKAMVQTPTWRAALSRNRWADAYLDGLSFTQFIDREQQRWADVVEPPKQASETWIVDSRWDVGRESALVIGLGLFVLGTAGIGLVVAYFRRRRAAQLLDERCRQLTDQLDRPAPSPATLIKNVIDDDFGEWCLSGAESDIAWFMLRGLPLREIADIRGTSERTVRQQAQAIYRKAGLDGRSDLAGRVLERFI